MLIMKKININVLSIIFIILLSMALGMCTLLIFEPIDKESSSTTFISMSAVFVILIYIVIKGNIKKYKK
jgi:hypothetical protein